MNRIYLKFAFCLLLFTCTSSVRAQTEKGPLNQALDIRDVIAPGETHQYSLKLAANQFAFIQLMQQGIDVKINTYDPSGLKIAEFDSPNGANGPETITLISDIKGEYILEVIPFNEEGPSGAYTLSLKHLKPKARTEEEQIDQLFTAWDRDDSPGVAVAIIQGGEIIFKKGYGIANLEYGIPITPSSVFHIASISKQFTAFSILLLAEEGKLALDDDIRQYIPEVPDFGSTITHRHLATHTSAIRDQWSLLQLAGWRMDDVITLEHVLKLVSKQKELNFEPGEEYSYCNTGFTLLAEVVSRVSGMSFAEFTEEHIFKPLEMKSTLFYNDHERIVKNRAYSYSSEGSGFKKRKLNFANVGATSLFTTVEDLSLWAANFKNLIVGSEAIFKQLRTPARLNNGEEFGGALGQFVGTFKGLREIEHGGADAGYRAFLARFPDQDFAVAVFSNSGEFNSSAAAHSIADIYLEKQYKQDPKEEEVAGEVVSETVASVFDPSSVEMEQYEGLYHSDELTTEYRIKAVDNGLLVTHSRLSDFVLRPQSEDTFTPNTWSFGRTAFIRDEHNHIIGFRVSSGRAHNVLFDKVD